MVKKVKFLTGFNPLQTALTQNYVKENGVC